MISELMGIAVGFVAVAGTLILLMTAVVMDNKSRRIRTRFLHEERMLALEKGLPVPMELSEQQKKRRPYVRGLVFAAIGIGCSAWGGMSDSQELSGLGMIPLFVGIALVIADLLTERRNNRLNRARERYAAAQNGYPAEENLT